MWVTKLLISPVKKRIFCPKTTQFGLKLAFFVHCRLIWCPVGGSVGGCGARAVSRKTPIYFIFIIHIILIYFVHISHRLPHAAGRSRAQQRSGLIIREMLILISTNSGPWPLLPAWSSIRSELQVSRCFFFVPLQHWPLSGVGSL